MTVDVSCVKRIACTCRVLNRYRDYTGTRRNVIMPCHTTIRTAFHSHYRDVHKCIKSFFNG